MELSFVDLSKREVVSVTDGKCMGRIVDLTLDFPKGNMISITVPARKSILNVFGIYDRLVIESYKIKKIGSDVILVDLQARKPSPPKPDCCCPPLCPPLCGGEVDDEGE